MATREAWGAVVALCGVALVGCGDDSDGSGDDDATRRRNIVVKTVLPDSCLPRPLLADGDGRTGAFIIETTAAPCDCSRPARAASPRDEMAAVRDELTAKGICGGDTAVSCSGYCGCRILELAGSSNDPTSPLYACQNQTTVSDPSYVGFCYIAPGRVDENDMPAPLGNPELVADCLSTQWQRIRFIGAETPLPGANLFISAPGASNPQM